MELVSHHRGATSEAHAKPFAGRKCCKDLILPKNRGYARKPPCLSASQPTTGFSAKSRKRGVFRQNRKVATLPFKHPLRLSGRPKTYSAQPNRFSRPGPFYHKRDETIRGPCILQFPGLRAETGVGQAHGASGLDNLQRVEANFQGQTLSIPQSSPGAGFVGVALQPILRELL